MDNYSDPRGADPQPDPARDQTVGGWLPAGTCGAQSVLKAGGHVIGSLSCTLDAGHDIDRPVIKGETIDEITLPHGHRLLSDDEVMRIEPGTPHAATVIWGNAPAIEACRDCQLGKHGLCVGLTWDVPSVSTVPCPCYENNRGMHP